jgi:hypothetical protein
VLTMLMAFESCVNSFSRCRMFSGMYDSDNDSLLEIIWEATISD